MRLAENREATRVRALFHAEIREEECRRKLVGSLPWGIPTVVVYR